MKNEKAELFTHDESMVLMLYARENRNLTMWSLKEIRGMLTADEVELNSLTESVLKKLEGISDADFLQIELIREMFS